MSAPWNCKEDRAFLSLGAWNAEIDLLRPWHGVENLSLGGREVPCRLLQIDPRRGADAAEIVDRYTRGNDLVVTYAETERRPVRRQIYWRAAAEEADSGAVAGVELIVSTQTSLLESDPTLEVVSEFSTGKTLHCRNGPMPSFHELACGEPYVCDASGGTSLLLHRPAGWECSFALFAHPSDFEHAEIAPAGEGGVRIAYRLFRPGLEKGVIRRGRLRAALVRRSGDEQAALAAYIAFAASPPPLTT